MHRERNYRPYRWLVVALFCLGLAAAWHLPAHLQSTPDGVQSGPGIDPALARALTVPSDAPLRIIVYLRGETTPAVLAGAISQDNASQPRAQVVAALQHRLSRAVMPLEAQLAAAQRRGELLRRRDLWIVNALALEARPALIHTLQASPAVAELRLDQMRQYVAPKLLSVTATFTDVAWGVERIDAPEVWRTLALSGTGAVVAGMDTGVEWEHPALAENYRGNLGKGQVSHRGAWFDAVNGGITPYDDHGHGSHTLGTAVGRGGIGVAPGARWIGVKVLNGNGSGYDADIHAGFQWLLAPEGDPALAPDIVVCSWGSTQSTDQEFQPDIEALLAAGIFPIFAAGNEGAQAGTLRSPASLPGVFAVGASDPYERVASFSSRGPSPWDEIKPYVVAPGVNIPSSVPGSIYAESQGTSMATPHVAGIAALMRGVSPTLSVEHLARVITETAVPLTNTVPNHDSGWGRADAYAALMALTRPGLISGTVRGPQGPLRGAHVRAAPHGVGHPGQATTDATGRYRLALSPGVYDLTATAFGHASQTVWRIRVSTETTQRIDFTLTALPRGWVRGRVTVAPTGLPPTRPITLRALETPVTTTLDAQGRYALTLPAGEYVVEVRGNGYRVVTASVTVQAEETTQQDFDLTSAPTLLLVDEGAWYYQSQINYWREALDALRYAYDEHAIIHPPVASDFLIRVMAYDTVLWSSPQGSPGLVGAGEVLTDYLSSGGRLLLSGQDVAFFDSGTALSIPGQRYLYKHLGVRYIKDDASSRTLRGAGPFDGLTIAVAGGTGANNQRYPDEIAVHDADVSQQVWHYAGGAGGGVAAHICTPYRALFFSFGYEAIADAATRREVMARSLDWLTLPPPTTGLTLTYPQGPHIGLPGEQVTHTFRVRHIGSAGPPDHLHVELTGNQWPASVTPSEMTLAPCESQYVTVTTTIPPDAGVNESDFIQVKVHSSLLEEPITTTLWTKTPAPILLVDDDRWYPMEGRYIQALKSQHLPYDVWNTDTNRDGRPNTGEIMTATLEQHPIVVWFTAYDWYEAVSEEEERRLLHYLDDGGRLLLSGQDFLYYDDVRPLAVRMGVGNWVYDRATTSAWGEAEHPAGGLWGPVVLDFPFRNWSDAVEPMPAASVVARGDEGQPLSVAHGGIASRPWRTLFYAFPLETLPPAERGAALAKGIGWLSPLGTSTWSVTPTAPLPGETLTLALTLHNDGPEGHTVVITHTTPSSVTPLLATLPPEMTYDADGRELRWTGEVAPDVPVKLRWQAEIEPQAVPGRPLTPTVAIKLAAWDLAFSRTAALWIGGADLGSSAWLSPTGSAVQAGKPVTLTFTLRNHGPDALQNGEVHVWLTPGLAPLTATLPPTRGLGLRLWQGELPSGASQKLSLTVRPWTGGRPLRLDALLDDGTGQRWTRALWLDVIPWRLYLPVIYKMTAP
ncbi:MAG: S8 family serine peptidase [Anaerolineae bacterium]